MLVFNLSRASVTKKSIKTLTPRDLEALGIAVLRRLAVPTVNGDDASPETDGSKSGNGRLNKKFSECDLSKKIVSKTIFHKNLKHKL